MKAETIFGKVHVNKSLAVTLSMSNPPYVHTIKVEFINLIKL